MWRTRYGLMEVTPTGMLSRKEYIEFDLGLQLYTCQRPGPHPQASVPSVPAWEYYYSREGLQLYKQFKRPFRPFCSHGEFVFKTGNLLPREMAPEKRKGF